MIDWIKITGDNPGNPMQWHDGQHRNGFQQNERSAAGRRSTGNSIPQSVAWTIIPEADARYPAKHTGEYLCSRWGPPCVQQLANRVFAPKFIITCPCTIKD